MGQMWQKTNNNNKNILLTIKTMNLQKNQFHTDFLILYKLIKKRTCKFSENLL